MFVLSTANPMTFDPDVPVAMLFHVPEVDDPDIPANGVPFDPNNLVEPVPASVSVNPYPPVISTPDENVCKAVHELVNPVLVPAKLHADPV